jgi:hypothetical protein
MFDIATIICAQVAAATTVHGPGMATAVFTATILYQGNASWAGVDIVWAAATRRKTRFHDAGLCC